MRCQDRSGIVSAHGGHGSVSACPINPAQKAVVACTAQVDKGDVGAFEQVSGINRQINARRDRPGAIDDALISAVTAQDIVRRVQEGGRFGRRFGLRTSRVADVNGPGFGERVAGLKRAVRQRQIWLSGGHVLQAMAAGHPALFGTGMAFDRIAVTVTSGAVDVVHIRAGQSMKFKSHYRSPFHIHMARAGMCGRPGTCGNA